MFRHSPDLLSALRTSIEQLGSHGGLISPSVYETAQVLRLHPPVEGVVPGLEWLLAQQHTDGGWGVVTVPLARDVPTLAAILALHYYRHEIAADGAIQAGLDFLQRQAPQWMSMHIECLPIAAELIMPQLLEEAGRMGLSIDPAPYARLFELRRVKLQHLEGKPILPNSSPTFSWEALGFPHMTAILHPLTGVGHSPAATAAWLHTAQQVGEDPILCAQAEAYLQRAAAITSTGIAGVMPMAYPVTGFELCYGLYALHLTGLLYHPHLQDVVAPKIAELQAMLERGQGMGFSEHFVADVDDTSVAVIVLRAAQQSPDSGLVHRFWHQDHFYTYLHELNPSVFSNAHALHALNSCGERSELTEEFLIRQQTESGAWNVDKWHTSWRASTLEVVAALVPLGYEAQLLKAGEALVADQNCDGSWGSANGAPILETAYSVTALELLSSIPDLVQRFQPALQRARQWLWAHVDILQSTEQVWLCKEVYAPVRVDNVYKLCVLLSPELHKMHPDDKLAPESNLVTSPINK